MVFLIHRFGYNSFVIILLFKIQFSLVTFSPSKKSLYFIEFMYAKLRSLSDQDTHHSTHHSTHQSTLSPVSSDFWIVTRYDIVLIVITLH